MTPMRLEPVCIPGVGGGCGGCLGCRFDKVRRERDEACSRLALIESDPEPTKASVRDSCERCLATQMERDALAAVIEEVRSALARPVEGKTTPRGDLVREAHQ